VVEKDTIPSTRMITTDAGDNARPISAGQFFRDVAVPSGGEETR
jgi:hypothetical protein